MTTIQGKDGHTIHITPKELHKKADASAWFVSDIKVPANAQKLLVQYVGIPEDQVTKHVTDIRDRAFKTWPLPCIGQARFLELVTSKHPNYPLYLEKLQAGGTFLDAGCCLGQDIRQLLLDGAPDSGKLYGTDFEGVFFGLGYELFKSHGTLRSTFQATDLTQPLGTAMAEFRERMDVISAQSLFHLFGRDGQMAVASALVHMSRLEPGSLISGRQLGHQEGRNNRGLTEDSESFFHNPDTWSKFWKEIGDATGTQWRVQTCVEAPPERVKKQKWYTEGVNFLLWTVTRE